MVQILWKDINRDFNNRFSILSNRDYYQAEKFIKYYLKYINGFYDCYEWQYNDLIVFKRTKENTNVDVKRERTNGVYIPRPIWHIICEFCIDKITSRFLIQRP